MDRGLTGRAALFGNPVRQLPGRRGQRSLAVETLLRSYGALVNPFFVARLTAWAPTRPRHGAWPSPRITVASTWTC